MKKIILEENSKELSIAYNELLFLRAISVYAMQLEKAVTWEEFREHYPVEKCQKNLFSLVNQFKAWLVEAES